MSTVSAHLRSGQHPIVYVTTPLHTGVAALNEPHTCPARFDTGPSGAGGAGSRVDVVDGVATRSALEAVPDALDAGPVAEGAEPHPAVEVDLGDVSHRSTLS